MALGEVDYGLMGVVGGLTAFVSFFNSLLAGAVGRFYAFSVGASHKEGNEQQGIEECRKWFNTALMIHTLVPVVLMLIGYPFGEWAVRHFLTIPSDRIQACVWVWRFTCISCFVGMFNVPFAAMYGAKQEIAELTIYSFVTTTLNAAFLYYIVNHPSVWLVQYAMWTCVLSIVPQMIISVNAMVKYKECHFNAAYLFSRERLKGICVYAFARFWAELSIMLGSQARAIMVNKFEGPQLNASMAIGNNVASHATTLAGSLVGAFWPVVMNKAGEGAHEEMRRYAMMANRIGTLFVLIFALPLMMEITEVLHLWLVTPPEFTAEVCVTVLASRILSSSIEGHAMMIIGVGNGVMRYSWISGWLGIALVGLAYILFVCGLGMWSVCISLFLVPVAVIILRLVMCKSLVNVEASYWFKEVAIPIFLLICATLAIGCIPRFTMPASFMRVLITTCAMELVLVLASWFFVLTKSEREFAHNKLVSLVIKIRGRS